MGRIKSKLVKRTGNSLLNEDNRFINNFEENKLVLKDIVLSKKIRNQISGYVTRRKKKMKRDSEVKTLIKEV